MKADDPRHGTLNGYSNLGCRCDRCREPWAAYMANRRAERAAILAADPRRGIHGLASTYQNWGCRCEPCRTAHTASNKRYGVAR